MPRKSKIEEGILRYLKKKRSPVTFKELYGALNKFSKQGIRNRTYKMIEEGIVQRTRRRLTTGGRRISLLCLSDNS